MVEKERSDRPRLTAAACDNGGDGGGRGGNDANGGVCNRTKPNCRNDDRTVEVDGAE
jgi:hypothetical protein